ncbi:B12-binding domain-containing radical SAM protein [Spirochaetia bacterium]|nr:B12-binding domain-containing radical SAM protein [Spirochaetia bacterium]
MLMNTANKNASPRSPASIILAAVHLEECPEAVALGAASIASALKPAFSGVSVSLVETFVSDGPEALVKKIRNVLNIDSAASRQDTAPSAIVAVGFSLYSWNRALMTEAARTLRERAPGANLELFLFCGGPEATALPGALLRSEGGPFDALIRGEGEEEAVRILTERFFTAGEYGESVHPRHISDLARLPSPWLDGTLLPDERRGVLWELARGCPYSCAYCYESRGFAETGTAGSPGARRVRYIPEERLRAELRVFVQKKVPYVFVLDPTFNCDNKRALHILDMIEQESAIGTHWHFEVRGELLNREQARRFFRIGASVQIGLQTVNPLSASLIGRSLNRGQFASRLQILNEEGVIFGLDLIYGLPGDKLSEYRKSLDFALSLYPNNLDMFRLSVLPGTLLWDRAQELGLRAKTEAPYEVISTPDFSEADLNTAERLSKAADRFYNQGRAVAWFNQVLYPLKMKPSVFLEGFMKYSENIGIENTGIINIEAEQLAWLETIYTRVKKRRLLPAIQDIVRFNGAWGRALAEGISTGIDFHYDPEELLGEAGMDIESFAASFKQSPVKGTVRPGNGGPVLQLATFLPPGRR